MNAQVNFITSCASNIIRFFRLSIDELNNYTTKFGLVIIASFPMDVDLCLYPFDWTTKKVSGNDIVLQQKTKWRTLGLF